MGARKTTGRGSGRAANPVAAALGRMDVRAASPPPAAAADAAAGETIKRLSLYLNRSAWAQLQSLAVRLDARPHSLLIRALNELFVREGLSPLARDRQKKEGVVQLLHLPALYGDKYPDLAGAGLYEAAKALEGLGDGNALGVSRLRTELLTRYAQTYHGQRLKAELDAKVKKPPVKTGS